MNFGRFAALVPEFLCGVESFLIFTLKAPQPADGWSGIRDATKPGATAPCIDMFTGTGGVAKSCDEDCLFLNVYTKDVSKPEKKYPVMVWIHGGGFTSGSGNKDIYSPDFLMSRDVVIVSMNYRLGALGESKTF